MATGFFGSDWKFDRPPDIGDLSGILHELTQTIQKLIDSTPSAHPLMGRNVATVPVGPGFFGANAAAPIPPPMPGSVGAMYAAGAGQYASPIGPQQYQFQMPNSLGQYRPHDVGGGSGGFNLAERVASDALGAIPTLLAGAANYTAGKTPYGTTGTTDMLGQNLKMGALKAFADFAEGVPGLGAFAKKQFEGLEEAVYLPEQRARNRLSPTFERMAMAGIEVKDSEIEEAFKFALPMERRGVYMKQRLDRIGAAVNAEGGAALSGALSQIGF